VDTAIEHDWLRVVLLNNSRRDSHQGFITPEQIAWLSAQCDSAARQDQLMIFAMHVPVHPNAHPDRGWFVKPEDGQTAFYELLRQHAARVLALFHGHFHNGLRGWDDHAPVHEVCFPSALYNQDRKLAAQRAPGYNPAEFRPGYACVSISAKELVIGCRVAGAGEALRKQLPRKSAA
jgi:hypothetical protein